MRVRLLLLDGLFLQVLGNDHAGDAAFGERDAERAIDRVPHGGDVHHGGHVVVRDVLEETLQVDFLLVIAAHRRRSGLPDDRDHRLVIHRGVVQAVEEVDRSRSGSSQADARLTGELRVRARHERGHLFVPDLHEPRLVAQRLEARHDSVDAVAGITEDPLHAPLAQPPYYVLADRLCHRATLPRGS